MKLENQVTNLELSRKLKKLRVKQESYFAWAEVNVGDKEFEYQVVKNDFQADIEFVSAFTVAELGEMLSKYLLYNFFDMPNICDKGWEWELEKADGIADTEANARAKMLIYLIENGLIKVGQ